ncbi:MAG: YceI family protein [Chitinophagales bacterium]
MQKLKILILTTITSFTMLACKQSPGGDKAKTTEAQEVTTAEADKAMNVDVSKSILAFIGTKVTAHHAGIVNIKSGKLMAKGTELTGGNFVIDMQTVTVNNGAPEPDGKLTGHLKSPDFFDVAKYPEAKFEITGVKPFSGSVVSDNSSDELDIYKVSDPNMTINGNLTIKDVTKNIEFPAKVTMNDAGVTAIAKFMVDRKLWGLNYPGMPDDLIRDEIWFGINLAAN